jgi:hypothetical protein
LLASARAFL